MGHAALYVHIPYCLAKCPYCDFNSYAARTWPEDSYADALLAELDARAVEEPLRSAEVTTLFFGGGTPSLFAPRTIGRILDGVARATRIAPGAEITLEANPGTVDEDRLRGFREAGVNRLSFGIQSFQPDLLLALGRQHSVDDSRRALAAARRAGFDNLSLDLIYAVPGQSLAACEADIAEAVDIAPEHVSAYNLTFEKGTAYHRDLAAGRLARAPEELEIAMFGAVRERLGSAGYEAYEISNHAQPGRTARHNQAYWQGLPYVGLGAGAHSFLPLDGRAPEAQPAAAGTAGAEGDDGSGEACFGVRWENLRDPNRWAEAVRSHGTAVASSERLDRRTAQGETCWLALRESRGLDLVGFERRFGETLPERFPHVADLEAEGLVCRQEGRLALTPRGLLVADSVFASFF